MKGFGNIPSKSTPTPQNISRPKSTIPSQYFTESKKGEVNELRQFIYSLYR